MPKKKLSKPSFSSQYVIGEVDHVSASYAYIVPQDNAHSDILVYQENLLGAIHQDLVKVKIHQKNSSRQSTGRVVAIVKKRTTPIVGRLVVADKRHWVIPDGRRMHQRILIEGALLDGRENDKVIVQLANRLPLIGNIQQVLGKTGLHEVEMHAIMAEFGLPTTFDKRVIEVSEAIPEAISPREIKRRKDFRKVPTVTIDPEDAKDFDDALSVRKLKNGHYEVGVHIADASYYVPMDGVLDQEALSRGTSVYLVDRTIPMLPERLSNGLCSLRPQEDKLSFSVVFELTNEGHICQAWIGETIIHSDKRFTYEEAQQVLDNGVGAWCEELQVLNNIAQKLREKRFERGAINFETPEVKFQLDKAGKPIRLVPKVRKATHKLVEEWMLLANAHVATHVAHMRPEKNEPTFVYRIHDNPDPEKLSEFWMLTKQLGFKPQVSTKRISEAINATTSAVQGHAAENIVQSLAIRSMAKAIYTTEDKGHFGLALKHYTHFTSPIRRYSDIMVHRLLKQYLGGNFNVNQKTYRLHCQHASARERVAADAERASIRYKQVEWMQSLKGDVLEGIISGVTSWGIYVTLNNNHCEGMIRLADIKDDYYFFDEQRMRVIGKRHKKVYRLADAVKVRVLDCDLMNRTIALALLSREKVS